VRVAYDAGIAEVLLPADNIDETKIPTILLEWVTLTLAQTVDDVLAKVLMVGSRS